MASIADKQPDSCLPQILQAIEHKSIDELFAIQLKKPTRLELDSIPYTEENRQMLDIAKLVISLKEVEMLERVNTLPTLNTMMTDPTKIFQAMFLMNSMNYKALITVPNKHSTLANNPVYRNAIADEEKVNVEDRQKIYQKAWEKVSFQNSQLSLLILEPLQDWSFPSYAFEGICKGLISRYPLTHEGKISLIAFPFGMDERHLNSLCQTLKDKEVTEMHLTLRPSLPFSALDQFVQTIKACKLQKLTLLGLDPQFYQQAKEIASAGGIELTLGNSPYQPLPADQVI